MNKKEVMSFFNELAPQWDARMVTDDQKMEYILDAAGVIPHVSVLDVACGTGVLFPYLLARNVSHVTGVDFSSEMARIAAGKIGDPRLEVLHGDIELLPVFRLFDCCIVYNAFPHFEDPARLIERLTQWLRPEGRLTIAHGMSLEALHRHHAERASRVSKEMLSIQALAEICQLWLNVDTTVSDDEKYVLSGRKKARPEQ